jgi:L-lactate dehydrogenase complex protein LldF
METQTRQFRQNSVSALADANVQKNLAGLYSGFHSARLTASSATSDWQELSDVGRRIKAHVIENLDYYLEMLARNVERAGGHVYFAKDAQAASDYVAGVARKHCVDMVIKSKSMLSEEMGLNERLEAEGIEPVETDLGEYIVQLAGDTPFHIIAPAIHKSREDVSQLFTETLGSPYYEDIEDLGREARVQLRQKFMEAGMGVSGANFLVAETGTVTLVTNEGNGRLCTSAPRIHIGITGMEKVIPSMQDLAIFLRLLPRSATGQRISSYVSMITGPRREDDEDGPEEFHLVLVDNGRSRMLRDPKLREALYCIRCGACLNICPVYQRVGGHSYGWVYPGPIGAVVSPMLTGLKEAKALPQASSLCGACREACPVKINIPRMLLELRHRTAESEDAQEQASSRSERFLAGAYGWLMGDPGRMTFAAGMGRIAQKLLPGMSKRDGWIRRAPLPLLSQWTQARDLPPLPPKSFREIWRDELSQDSANEVDGGRR